MTLVRLTLLAGSLSLLAGAAAWAGDDSAPISTASQSTDAKIAQWIKDAPPDNDAADGGVQADGPPAKLDRQIHGEMGAAIGSNGYRNAYGVATIPIGSSSSATIGISTSSGRGYFGGGRWSAGSGFAGPGPVGGPWFAGPRSCACPSGPASPDACAAPGAPAQAPPPDPVTCAAR
jgi:hypothetical protein